MKKEFADTDTQAGQLTQPPASTVKNIRAPHGNAPRHIGWIEPWIGGSIASYTALTALLVYAQRPVLWLYAALAAALAWWSWQRPARRQTELLLRAAVFMLMGFLVLVHSHQDPLAAGNDFFYWITVPLILYAFVLKARLAWGLLALSLSAYLLLMALTSTAATAQTLLLQAAYCFIFSVAAVRMGAVSRRADELLEARRVDTSSGLLNEYGFLDHGAELWRYCRRAHIPATLVFLDIPDLRKIREVYDAEASRMAAAKVLDTVSEFDVGKHVLARLSSWRFALLMPGTTREQAFKAVADRLGQPPKIEVDDDHLEVIFPIDVHAVESKLQGTEFARFYETELAVLDTRAERKPVPAPQPMAMPKPAFDLPAGETPAQAATQLPATVPLGL